MYNSHARGRIMKYIFLDGFGFGLGRNKGYRQNFGEESSWLTIIKLE